jgi:hypothetical protein
MKRLILLLLLIGGSFVADSSPLTFALRPHVFPAFVNWRRRIANATPPLTEAWYVDGLALGTPPQPMRLLFDTGSPWPWAYLSSCESSCCRKTTGPVFDPNASASFSIVNSSTRKLCYGVGCFDAVAFSDVLTMKPLGGRLPFAVPFRSYGTVRVETQNASFVEGYIQSGVNGMEIRHPSSWVGQLVAARVVAQPVVGFVFGSVSSKPGVLHVGSLDTRLFKQPIVWLNSSQRQISAVTIDGRPAPLSCDSNSSSCVISPDTGAGVFSAQTGLRWTIGADCKGKEKLPTIGLLLFETLRVELKPSDYIIETETVANGGNVRRCQSGLAEVVTVDGGDFSATVDPLATGVWLLCGRFLAAVYAVLAVDSDGSTTFGFAARR